MTRCATNTFYPTKVPKKKHAKIQVLKLPSNLLFGTDMFTFDTRLHFTHTYKFINVQKKTFKFIST